MLLTELQSLLDALLLGADRNPQGSRADDVDPALNGLQVGRRGVEVRRMAASVDACAETFRRAADWGAELLLCHHGLFWGSAVPLVGEQRQRVQLLFDHDLALYGCHLPLDCHPTLGNNAQMAEVLGLVETRPFGRVRGVEIGYQGRLPRPLAVSEVAEALFGGQERCLSVLPFGAERVETVGFVSGGGGGELQAAVDHRLDLFVTGDADHVMYHNAMEAAINVISAGHYRSETFGVEAVAAQLRHDTSLETTFIDLETGL